MSRKTLVLRLVKIPVYTFCTILYSLVLLEYEIVRFISNFLRLFPLGFGVKNLSQ